ncbi:MAG: hypothetical protein ACETWD_00965 [Desulfatiglandales bacterium]
MQNQRGKQFHIHDLRHTFCSNPFLKSVDLKHVKEIIEYNDPPMTCRYSYLTLHHKCVWRDRPAERYGNLPD